MNAPLSSQGTPLKHTQAIAQRMRARRKEAHLSQIDLSVRSGVSLGSLKRFERSGEISLMSLAKLADALGCEDDLQVLFAPEPAEDIREALKTLETYIEQHGN